MFADTKVHIRIHMENLQVTLLFASNIENCCLHNYKSIEYTEYTIIS